MREQNLAWVTTPLCCALANASWSRWIAAATSRGNNSVAEFMSARDRIKGSRCCLASAAAASNRLVPVKGASMFRYPRPSATSAAARCSRSPLASASMMYRSR